MKYRKKPVIVEARQWDGSFESIRELAEWCSALAHTSVWRAGHNFRAEIQTLEGPLQVSPGDFIIQGVQGEFYPCKPDIFGLTYEPAE